MGVNSTPKTVTRQRSGCDLNPGPSAPKSSTLTVILYISLKKKIRLADLSEEASSEQINKWTKSMAIIM